MRSYDVYYQRCQDPRFGSSYLDYAQHKALLKSFYSRRRQLAGLVNDNSLTVSTYAELTNTPIDSHYDLTGYFAYEDDAPIEWMGCGECGKIDFAADDAPIDCHDAMLRLSILERKEFSTLLESQLDITANFYTSTLLTNVRSSLDKKDYINASRELLETVSFAAANIITFRQLLCRYDAFCRTFDSMPLNEWMLQRSVLGGDHAVHELFQLDVARLEKEIVIGLQNLKKKDRPAMSAEEFSASIQSFGALLAETETSLSKAVSGHLVFKDRMFELGMRIRNYLLIGFRNRGLTDQQKSTSMRGRHFKKEIKVIAKWRTSGVLKLQSPEQSTFKQNLKEVKPENVFPLILNLVSCFLFMMNNYIIEPSSAYYAEALGRSDALSGMMIGMAPWFALASSIVYSYWTNYNYKWPILFAGLLQFIGNLMYANAYGHGSVGLCLIGRAVTGLGAPRIINRRYVADATPFSLRTAASAAFAMCTALGAALGPGMAIILDNMNEFTFYLPGLGTQYFNGMTGPGYFMALNWFIYTVFIVFFFGEPTRSGLDELRRREETKSQSTNGPDSKKESLLSEVELANMSLAKTLDRQDTSMSLTIDRQNTSMSLDDAIGVDTGVLSFDGDEDFLDDTSLDLSQDGSTDEIESEQKRRGYGHYCFCIQNMTKPVVICMSLIFMKRIALESIVGSTSIVTKNRYGWIIQNVGELHLTNGLIVIPVSIYSGYLSTMYEDRLMALWFLGITLIGMCFLFDPTDLFNAGYSETFNLGLPFAVGPARYITGSLIAFSGIEACESFVASLMSKVVPSALAQGTFNSGLLATLVGTGGRAMGDLFITLMGLISIRQLLNLLIIPGIALVGLSIAIIRWNYDLLAV